MYNILTIAVYNESNGKYRRYFRYFLFSLPDLEAEEIVILLYINNRHYNLIYPKRNDQKNKKLYFSPNQIDKSIIQKRYNKKIKIIKYNEEYVKVKYQASSNIYNEIAEFLNNLEKYNEEINKKIKLYPKIHINQIYNYFALSYPKRLQGNSLSLSNKRRAFRELCNNFKLNNIKRLLIKNPYKENFWNNYDKWYKIPFQNEKNIIINNYHWNYNHCGWDAIIAYIKEEGWYCYGFFKDVETLIKEFPQYNNGHSKFKNFKAKIKAICDNGPHYCTICDLWYLSNNISTITGYNYILDIMDHFTKWYQGYCLITKGSEEVLSCIISYIQSFGKTVILQADNGLEFYNFLLNNYCINNNIKLVHGKVKHPQFQGACESCHKEIKKY